MSNRVIFKQLGVQDYTQVWQAMQRFVAQRTPATTDEIWLVEHPAVFTQGQAGKEQHLLSNAHNIPIIHTDRGGQITYHGPGQLIFYLLLDLKRRKQGIKGLVCSIEQAVIDYLASLKLTAFRQAGAPGVYVDAGKIAFLGLKVKRWCTYHGVSFNFDMDLEPFNYINPCGYPDLALTRLVDLCGDTSKQECIDGIYTHLLNNLYT
jgi:lipoyl(octanoyl) transferase